MFATFPLILFFIGAILLVALPIGVSLQSYFRNRGRRTVICPDNHQPVTVEVDSKFAFSTALRGQEHERLHTCSRWPEKGDCGQECLAQVNPSPENLERLLQKWYQGKTCAICERPLDSCRLAAQPPCAAQRKTEALRVAAHAPRPNPVCFGPDGAALLELPSGGTRPPG